MTETLQQNAEQYQLNGLPRRPPIGMPRLTVRYWKMLSVTLTFDLLT